MSYDLCNVLAHHDVPKLWSRGCAYAYMDKSSGVVDLLRAAGSGAVRLGRGARSAYQKTLPASTWRDAASLPERVAERAGFFALPAAAAYYLTRKRRGPQGVGAVHPEMAYQPANYPPY